MKKHRRFWGLDWPRELFNLFIAWLSCMLVPLAAILVISHLHPDWIVNGTGMSLAITWGALLLASSLILGFAVGRHQYWRHSFEMIAAGTIALLGWAVVAFDTSINGQTSDAAVREYILTATIPLMLFLAIMLYAGAVVGVIVRRSKRRKPR